MTLGEQLADISDERIELVARQFCKNMGLDPDETVGGGLTDFGPNEYSEQPSDVHVVPAIAVYKPLWRRYWYKAKAALAMQAAVNGGGDE